MANGRCATDVSVQFPALEAVKCTCVSNLRAFVQLTAAGLGAVRPGRSVAVAEYTR